MGVREQGRSEGKGVREQGRSEETGVGSEGTGSKEREGMGNGQGLGVFFVLLHPIFFMVLLSGCQCECFIWQQPYLSWVAALTQQWLVQS